jgi:hypothetical protein
VCPSGHARAVRAYLRLALLALAPLVGACGGRRLAVRAAPAWTPSGSKDPTLAACPAHFAAEARGTWHVLGGQAYFIDAVGRPAAARASLPPIAADDARDSACQVQVGRWGDALLPSEDFDGGHLIGYQLGGFGGRANLVPQAASFNRGNWAQLENALATCAALEPGRIVLLVQAHYQDEAALVPFALSMTLRDTADDDAVVLTFENAARGGEHGAALRLQGLLWLRARGCDPVHMP